MSEEKLKLKLRLLTMNCLYLSYTNKTLENIVNGITNKECFGLLEEKKQFDENTNGYLNDLLLGYITQKDEDLESLDSATDEYISTMSKILIEINRKFEQNSP